MGCIYIAECRASGRGYVGQTVYSMDDRRRCHEMDAAKGSRLPLHCAMRKHGLDSFEWFVLHGDVPETDLDELETREIRRYGTLSPLGYNLQEGGSGGRPAECVKRRISKTVTDTWADPAARARKMAAINSPESMAKILAGIRRRWDDPAERAKIRLSYEERYGEDRAAEIKAKQSAALVGIVRSEEFKEKCRESAKRVPKHIRATGLLKVNAARAANGISDELRQKLRDSHRGKKLTAEQRAKISAGNKGKKRSPETVARMRAAQQARRAAERWAA